MKIKGFIYAICTMFMMGCTNNEVNMSRLKTMKTDSNFVRLLNSYNSEGYVIKKDYCESFDCVGYIETVNPYDENLQAVLMLVPETLWVCSKDHLPQNILRYPIDTEVLQNGENGEHFYYTSFTGYKISLLRITDEGTLDEDVQGFLMKDDFKNKNEEIFYNVAYDVLLYPPNGYALGARWSDVENQLIVPHESETLSTGVSEDS